MLLKIIFRSLFIYSLHMKLIHVYMWSKWINTNVQATKIGKDKGENKKIQVKDNSLGVR